ncbi:MAG: ABC transporter substrate-binding protein [Vulcanimicrobiaceae bacterium]
MKLATLLCALLMVIGLSFSALAPHRALAQMSGDATCPAKDLSSQYPGLKGRTIKVGMDPQDVPYAYRDPKNFDHIVGFEADFARDIASCLGMKVDFNPGAWSGIIPSVISGHNDVMMSNLYYTPKRAEQINYVVYMQAGIGGLALKDNSKKLASLEDLCGNSASPILGSVQATMLEEQSKKCEAAGKQPVQVIIHDSEDSGLRLIDNKRCDVLFSDAALVGTLVRAHPQYRQAFTVLSKFQIGVGMRKNEDQLLKGFYAVISELQANGTEKSLMEKYGIDTTLQVPAQTKTS